MSDALVPGDPHGIIATQDAFTKALARADTLPEVAHLVHYADAAKVVAREARVGQQAQREWSYLSLDAQRKAGQMLRQLPNLGSGKNDRLSLLLEEERPDVARAQSHRWQRVGAVPDDVYDAFRNDPEVEEPTRGGLWQRAALEERLARRAARADGLTDPVDLATLDAFDVIYADPPWRLGSPDGNRAVENHYDTMPVENIAGLRCPAEPDAVLFLWAVNSLLREALEVLNAWGFDYRTNLAWVKDKWGLGAIVRTQHELLLVGLRGDPAIPEPATRPSSVIAAPRREHSRKPDQVYGLIEAMYPDETKLEMFARQQRAGWAGWGNEVLP